MSDKQLAQCVGKTRFRSYKAAKRLAIMLSRRKDVAAQPYLCQHCRSFHVGTTVGGSEPTTAPYARKPYAVYAGPPAGSPILVGWSAYEDGHDVADILGLGWIITSVVRRVRLPR